MFNLKGDLIGSAHAGGCSRQAEQSRRSTSAGGGVLGGGGGRTWTSDGVG